MDIIKQTGVPAVLFCVVFFTTGLLVSILQVVVYALIGLWNLNLFRRINARLVTLNWSLFVCLADHYAELEVKMYGEPDQWEAVRKDKCLVIVNHSSDIDWLIGWVIADRYDVLGGTKCFMKQSAKHYPILGWQWRLSEFIWLDRNWNTDKATISKSCTQLQDFPLPYWVVVFPEGTRWTPRKQLASQQYAREKGFPVLNHLLTPRPRGFCYGVEKLRHSIDALYNVTFAFSEPRPTLLSVLRGEKAEVHCYLERLDLEGLPETDKTRTDCRGAFPELTAWLNCRFVAKDKLLEYHSVHGKFPGPQVAMPAKARSFYITAAWFAAHIIGLCFYAHRCITTGNLFGLKVLGLLFVGVMSTAGFLLSTSIADKTKVLPPAA